MKEASTGSKTLLSLYCECKLVRNEIILKDTSIAKNPQNKNKILMITKQESIWLKILNSKSNEEFCSFKISEVQEVYPQMMSTGKMTITTKAGLKVLISNAPPELLQKILPFINSVPTKTDLDKSAQMAKEEVKVIKVENKCVNPRAAAVLARKRKYQELRVKVTESMSKRIKTEPDPHIISLLKIETIEKLPYDVLGLIFEYIYDEILKLSLINKNFYKASNIKLTTLIFKYKYLPPEHFIALLLRFPYLKVLKLFTLNSIKLSDLKQFSVELNYLEVLDLSNMTNLTDGILQRIMEKTKKVSSLNLPLFAQLTNNSLSSCANYCQALEYFSFTSIRNHKYQKEARISNESIRKFIEMIANVKNINKKHRVVNSIAKFNLYYLNKNLAETIVKHCEEVISLKFAFVESDGCLSILGKLKNLKKISISPFSAYTKPILDDFISLLKELKEDSLEKVEVGEFADSKLINYLGSKFGNTLKTLKVHSMNIRDSDIEFISSTFKELSNLDISGCVATEHSIDYIESLSLKKLVIEMEKYFAYPHRQALIARLPNTLVKVKYNDQFLY